MHFSALNCRVDSLASTLNLPMDVLRLDLLDPVVSGNKWFKLKGYLQQAKEDNKNILLTFGGAYSNHIVATAAAAQIHGYKSIGVIRGEEPTLWSHTLKMAWQYDMNLFFTTRASYQEKNIPHELFEKYDKDNLFIIPEGGYGKPGVAGAKEMLNLVSKENYTHFLLAVGTGTTLAGIVDSLSQDQKVIGIPVLKNAASLQQEIELLLPVEKHHQFVLEQNYHFGGYAKKTPGLISFMNEFYQATSIPTDFVYTGKAFYAALDLFKKHYFKSGDKVLLVHTGGLQGNLSLPKGTLIFG